MNFIRYCFSRENGRFSLLNLFVGIVILVLIVTGVPFMTYMLIIGIMTGDMFILYPFILMGMGAFLSLCLTSMARYAKAKGKKND